MDTTLDYFHKQLTFRGDKGSSRWKDLCAFFLLTARYKRYFIREFFLNYFYYIYISVFDIGRMKRNKKWKGKERSKNKRSFDEDAASGVTTHLVAFRNSRGPAWSRVQMFRDKNVGKRKKEWQQVRTCCLRLGCITTLLCTFLPRAKCIPK